MKILKYLFFLLLLVFIGGAIYFGTKEGTYKVQETTTIAAHPQLVFNKVNDLNSWESWSPWKKLKPTDIFNTAEKASGEGASVSWDGTEEGYIKTIKVIPNSEIEQVLVQNTFMGDHTSEVLWNFNPTPSGTEVTWTIQGEHSLSDKIYLTLRNIDFGKVLYARMQESLKDLNQEIEEDMKAYAINVDGVTHFGGGYYMYTTSASQKSEVHNRIKPMFQEVSNFMAANNIQAAGKPFVLFIETDAATNTVIFSTCFPVSERIVTPQSSAIVSGFMNPMTAVKTTLKGHYENIDEAYAKAEDYVTSNGYEIDKDRDVFEVFSTDPEEVPNPADWITEIYIPIVSEPQNIDSNPEPEIELERI